MGKRTMPSYTCTDELGTYTNEEVDEHDVHVYHGRHISAPLRKLYMGDADQYIFKDVSTKTKRSIKTTKHKITKTKAEPTKLSLIQKDIREYGQLIVRKSTAKPKDINKLFQTILKW